MRLALLVVVIVAVALIAAVLYLAARNAVLKRKNADLTTLIAGLEEPELWLPKEERVELARERVARERQLQNEADIRRFNNM